MRSCRELIGADLNHSIMLPLVILAVLGPCTANGCEPPIPSRDTYATFPHSGNYAIRYRSEFDCYDRQELLGLGSMFAAAMGSLRSARASMAGLKSMPTTSERGG